MREKETETLTNLRGHQGDIVDSDYLCVRNWMSKSVSQTESQWGKRKILKFSLRDHQGDIVGSDYLWVRNWLGKSVSQEKNQRQKKETYQNFSWENLKEGKEVVAISEIFKQVPHITATLKKK